MTNKMDMDLDDASNMSLDAWAAVRNTIAAGQGWGAVRAAIAVAIKADAVWCEIHDRIDAADEIASLNAAAKKADAAVAYTAAADNTTDAAIAYSFIIAGDTTVEDNISAHEAYANLVAASAALKKAETAYNAAENVYFAAEDVVNATRDRMLDGANTEK